MNLSVDTHILNILYTHQEI